LRGGAQRKLELIGSQRRFEEAKAVLLPFGGEVGDHSGEEVGGERGVGGPAGPAVAQLIGGVQARRSIEGLGKHGGATVREGGSEERIVAKGGLVHCFAQEHRGSE